MNALSMDGPDEIEDTEIDAVYGTFYLLYGSHDVAGIDAAIRDADAGVDTLRVSVLLSVLTATARPHLRHSLTARPGFYARVRERLVRERGEETARLLLQGLG